MLQLLKDYNVFRYVSYQFFDISGHPTVHEFRVSPSHPHFYTVYYKHPTASHRASHSLLGLLFTRSSQRLPGLNLKLQFHYKGADQEWPSVKIHGEESREGWSAGCSSWEPGHVTLLVYWSFHSQEALLSFCIQNLYRDFIL